MTQQRAQVPSYQVTGPVLSTYLGLGVSPTGHGREIALRWRALRTTLAEQGATEELLHPVDELVEVAQPSPRTLAVFAHDGQAEAEELEDCDVPDAAALGPLPLTVPLLRWRQQWVPYLVVEIDRTGADLAAYLGAGPPRAQETVVGPDDEIERNAPGGWAGLAQPRYQRRAEDSWAHNAREVADHVVRLAGQVDARLIITAGDVRAVQELTDHLPEPLRRLQERVTSGLEQAAPGRARVSRDTIRELVHRAAAQARAAVVEEIAQTSGAHFAGGVPACEEALRRGAVRRLVLVDRPGDERIAWAWPEPQRFTVDDAPDDGAQPAPLREVLVRAALAQAAEVTVLGPDEAELPDDVAALLRF